MCAVSLTVCLLAVCFFTLKHSYWVTHLKWFPKISPHSIKVCSLKPDWFLHKFSMQQEKYQTISGLHLYRLKNIYFLWSMPSFQQCIICTFYDFRTVLREQVSSCTILYRPNFGSYCWLDEDAFMVVPMVTPNGIILFLHKLLLYSHMGLGRYF